jgi:hypothetical protein
VERSRSFRHEPAERTTEGFLLWRLEKQVDVIRHQRVCVYRDIIGSLHLPQVGEEHLKILYSGDVELSVIAAGHHMDCPAGGVEPPGAGHCYLLDGADEIIRRRILLHVLPTRYCASEKAESDFNKINVLAAERSPVPFDEKSESDFNEINELAAERSPVPFESIPGTCQSGKPIVNARFIPVPECQ